MGALGECHGFSPLFLRAAGGKGRLLPLLGVPKGLWSQGLSFEFHQLSTSVYPHLNLSRSQPGAGARAWAVTSQGRLVIRPCIVPFYLVLFVSFFSGHYEAYFYLEPTRHDEAASAHRPKEAISGFLPTKLLPRGTKALVSEPNALCGERTEYHVTPPPHEDPPFMAFLGFPCFVPGPFPRKGSTGSHSGTGGLRTSPRETRHCLQRNPDFSLLLAIADSCLWQAALT